MSELTQVEQLTKEIENKIASVPDTVLETILDNIPSDSMVGVSLRSQDSQALRERLHSLDMNDLGMYAQRLIHASQALNSDEVLKHIPHAEGLIKVIDGVAGMAHDSSEDDIEQERAFYDNLQTVAKVIPGVQSDGSPLAVEKLYQQNPETAFTGNSILEMAHQELSNEMLDDESRDYWTKQVKKLVPELRDRTEVFPDEIPMDSQVDEARDQATAFNDLLGKSSGQLLNSLYGSNRADPDPTEVLTPETATMSDVDFAEPVDHNTPDFVDDTPRVA